MEKNQLNYKDGVFFKKKKINKIDISLVRQQKRMWESKLPVSFV